jgi:DNA-directed RNA polymerase I subunit RPA12
VVTTRSASRPTPAWAILDEKKEAAEAAASGPARMTTQERCPKCDHPELHYYTMQLRSADEGQTVFYECSQCNHNFSVNN